jgi:hypothetical protein
VVDSYTNQAGAELAFARAMGFDDWGFEQESEVGVVRGFHVVWQRNHDAALPVPYDAEPDDLYALVTGEMPEYRVHGWTSVAAARLGRLSSEEKQ